METNNSAVRDYVVAFRHGDGSGERLLADFATGKNKEDFVKYLHGLEREDKAGDWYKLSADNFKKAKDHTKGHNYSLNVRDLPSLRSLLLTDTP
jgi:hypothetical protein